MRNRILSFVALFVLCVAASQMAFSAPQDAGDGQAGSRWPTPDEVVAKMDSKLSLSDDQKAKIKPIIADRQEKLKALAADSGRRRKKAREAKSIMEDSDKQITAVLNDDQRQKYSEVQQEMREQMRERRQQHTSAD